MKRAMNEAVAENLCRLRREKSARENRDVTQSEVAAAVGASAAAVSTWEKTGKISLDTAWALADYYGVPIGKLAGREAYEPFAAMPAAV